MSALRLDVINEWQSELDRAFVTIQKTNPEFEYTRGNFYVLVSFLRKDMRIPEERWTKEVFAAAHTLLRNQDGGFDPPEVKEFGAQHARQ